MVCVSRPGAEALSVFFWTQCHVVTISKHLGTVAHGDKTLQNTSQNPKHVQESKNTSKNPKHVPKTKNTSKKPKYFPESKTCLDSGKCF